MSSTSPSFLLIGNAPYYNRGCEAIVRGTMVVLRKAFGSAIQVTVGSYGDPDIVRLQGAREVDPGIRHIPLRIRRFEIAWFMEKCNRLGARLPGQYWPVSGAARRAKAVMEIGGDNYSVDAGGIPEEFMDMDRFILRAGAPLVLWGASVGPFGSIPEEADRVHAHLRKFAAIYVRESVSAEYLRKNRVDHNVRQVADPAFAMPASEPPPEKIGFALPDAPIGVNLSPFIAKYAAGRDLDRWRRICVEGLSRLIRQTGREVLLVPHVFHPAEENNDLAFLNRVAEDLRRELRVDVPVIPDSVTAAELKWVIARCAIFVGARTHSTIAALSSQTPTLSLGYSFKALGINQDLLGTREYCLQPEEMTAEGIAVHTGSLLRNAEAVRELLASRVPQFVQRAMSAGELLRDLLAH